MHVVCNFDTTAKEKDEQKGVTEPFQSLKKFKAQSCLWEPFFKLPYLFQCFNLCRLGQGVPPSRKKKRLGMKIIT